MEDLLKEEDFKKPYNPWPLFYKFYLFATAQIGVMSVLGENGLLDFDERIGIALIIIVPLFTALGMLLWKKENLVLNNNVILKAVAGLCAAYLLGMMILIIYFLTRPGVSSTAPAGQWIAYLLIYFTLFACIAVIVLVVKGVLKARDIRK
ncbi:MAG: hypothetical protein ACO1N9_00530 [Flavobacterium sp.]